MNSTNYVLELMISGICTFLWIGLLALTFWGDNFNYTLLERGGLIITIFLLPIIYVIGVITDRMSDELFEKLFLLRKKRFNNIDEHRKALSIVYVKSETLTKLFEYGRMRIRICRNWCINGLMILVSALGYIWFTSVLDQTTKWGVSLFLFIFLTLSVIASFYAWKNMNNKEFKFLELQTKLLEKSI